MLKKRQWKIMVWIITSGLLIGIFGAPYFSNFPIFRKTLQKIILNKTGYDCSYQKSSFSWLGKQKVINLSLHNKKLGNSIFIEEMEINSSLLFLALRKKIRKLSLKNWVFRKSNTSNPIYKTPSYKNTLSITNLCSENGSFIVNNPETADLLTVSKISLKKTKTSFFLDALTNENSIPGNVSLNIDSSNIQLKMKSVPLSLLLLPISKTYSSYGNFINVGCEMGKDKNGFNQWTCLARSDDLYAVLNGRIENSLLRINEDQVSFISIKSRLSTHILNNYCPENLLIKSSNLDIKLQEASIPLNLSKTNMFDIKGYSLINEIKINSSEQNLVLEKIKVNFRKVLEEITGALSSEILLEQERSPLRMSFKYDTNSRTTDIGLNQTNISKKFLDKTLSLAHADIIMPVDGDNYSLFILGKIHNSEFSGKVCLKDSLLNLDLEANGDLYKQYFKLKADYFLSQTIINDHNLPFNNFELNATGVSTVSKNGLSIAQITGKINNENGEINFHSKTSEQSHESCSLIIHGKITSLPFQKLNPYIQDFNLLKSDFALNFDGCSKSATGNINILLESQESPQTQGIRIDIPQISFSNINPFKLDSFKTAGISLSGKAFNLPLNKVVNICQIPGEEFAGYTADAVFKTDIHSEGTLRINIEGELKSKILDVFGNIKMNESLLLDKDSHLSFKLQISPEMYKSFFKNTNHLPSCMITRTAVLEGNIDHLSCKPKTQGFKCLQSLGNGDMKVSFSLSPLIFQDKETQSTTIIINEISGKFESFGNQNPTTYLIQGKCLSPNSLGNTEGKIIFSGEVTKPFSSKMTLNGSFLGENIYAPFITTVFPFSPGIRHKLVAFSDGMANFLIKTNISEKQGSIDVNLSSPELELTAPLFISPYQITANQDININFYINNSVIEEILREVNPLISLGAQSKHPISLNIKAKDFLIPINPYSFTGTKIGSGVLDLGQINIIDSENINSLLKLIGNDEIQHSVESWFTPIYFDLSQGILTCKRFDTLLNGDIHIALWGQTDINNTTMSMTLGIDPSVLDKYFKNIPYAKDKLFLVKIKGPISNPRIDLKSANSRLDLLKNTKLRQYFIGDILDKVFSVLGEKTPPPTTQPFPWKIKNN